MGGRKSVESCLVFGITTLFIISSFMHMTTGHYVMISNEEIVVNDFNFDCYNRSEISSYRPQFREKYSGFDSSSSEKIAEAPTVKFDGLMDSPWPMYCHDVRHTGRSPYTPVDYPIEKWRHDVRNGGYGSPAIDADGIIYFGGWRFYAFYPNGTRKWTSDFASAHSCPAIDEDGTIYVGIETGSPEGLYAFYPNGTIKWKYNAEDVFSSPAIANDGTIYFGGQDSYPPPKGSIYALNPNGTFKWKFQTNHFVYSSPAIGDDGTIYCGSHDQHLYALYPNNGTLKWKYKTDHWIRVSPCIADDGTIYIVSLDEYLYALYPNGTLKWKTNVGAGTSPTIGQDGTIYCGYDNLYAVNPNGTIKWIFNPGSGRRIRGGTPCNAADGAIYFGTSIDDIKGGEIIAVNPNGTERWRKLIANDYVEAAPCIADGGTIYVVSVAYYDYEVCYLHAFGTVESNNPPKMKGLNGPDKGEIYERYKYSFSASDQDNNPVGYFIDWGDGSTSGWTMDYEPNMVVHLWNDWKEEGNYTIKVKARDSVGAESDWFSLNITIDSPPIVKITKPVKGLYIFNFKLRSFLFRNPLIFGMIEVEVDASDSSEVNRVEFYVDDKLKSNDTSVPYSWSWKYGVFFKHVHTIKAVAYDDVGNSASDEIKVRRFF